MTGVILLSMLLAGQGQTHSATLNATYNGQPMGKMNMSVTSQSSGGIVEVTELSLNLPGQKMTERSREWVGPDGLTTHEEVTETVNGVVKMNLAIEFTKRGAKVFDKTTGKTKTYEEPKDGLGRDTSSLWFIVTHPKVGTTISSHSFSAETLTWDKSKLTYSGDKKVTIAGKEVSGHLTTGEQGGKSMTAIVDNNGLPLEADVSGVHLERD